MLGERKNYECSTINVNRKNTRDDDKKKKYDS
jgi:hypothetical protein